MISSSSQPIALSLFSLACPLARRFLLMCVVLRCCSDGESQSIFDLEEINLSATGYDHKPTAIVDGQPVSVSLAAVIVGWYGG